MIRSRSSPGGPVRERHREDLPRPDALDADEVGDPVGQDAGLAAAGAGEDEERSVGRRDGPRLLRVQVPDDLLGALRRGELAGRLLGGLPRLPLVRRQLRRRLAGERRVAQPVRLRGGRGADLRVVDEGGPLGRVGAVGRGAGGPPAGRGAHSLIVGRRPSRGLRPAHEEAPGRRCRRGALMAAMGRVVTGRSGPRAGPRRRRCRRT